MEVRIVRLGPLRYASAWGYGESPELAALERLLGWAAAKGLPGPGAGGRLFGFNNPFPTAEHPRYGYEVWLTIPDDSEPDGDIRLGEFFGGTYAVTRCRGAENIFPAWQELGAWVAASEYTATGAPGLEEHLSPPGTPVEDWAFNLYLPVRD